MTCRLALAVLLCAAGFAPASSIAPPAADLAAHITLDVPADATLLIQGQPTRQTGARRSFVSPQLRPGLAYTYQITVSWTEDDRPLEQVLELEVRAGDRQTVLVFNPRPAPADEYLPR